MSFSKELIAPCGMNCGVCIAYLREKNKCQGCLTTNDLKSSRGINCGKRNCNEHKKAEFVYCFECRKFPCSKMKSIEKRYVEKYHTSLIENLLIIKNFGLDELLHRENEKWKCQHCGSVLSVHRTFCLNCNQEYS
jgi:hypothetical protein